MVVAAATAVSRVVGLAREVLTAGYYGVDPNINTLISVSVVPNLVRQLVADAAVSAAFVPVITGLLVKGDAERARRLAATCWASCRGGGRGVPGGHSRRPRR